MTIKKTTLSTRPKIQKQAPVAQTKQPQKMTGQTAQATDQFKTNCFPGQKMIDGSQTKPRTGISRDLSNRLAQTQAPQAQTQAPQAQTQAPQAQTQAPQAQTQAPQAQTQAPGNETELGGAGNDSPLGRLTQENPGLRTNQDLINHCYQNGGGNWAGAQEVARSLGADLNQLVKDRGGSIQGGGPAAQGPAAPQGPATPAQPAPQGPAAPAQPGGTQPAPVAEQPTETAPAGRVDPTASTAGMSEAQKYDHYQALIEQNGGQFKAGANERNILSFRRETDADVNGGQGRYDDTTVMLWTDGNGNKRVREYESNTEPSARYRGRMGVDVNGDGRLDQGRLPAGYYEYTTGHSSKLGNVLRPTQSTNAERDTNQDGLFNDNAYGSAGRSMLFHKGGNSMTGSAGCQTMSPAEYNRFWNDLNSSGNPGNIGYTLINL